MKTWKGYEKGVNIGGWFSQCKYEYDHFESFISQSDIDTMKSWGLDHVRIPVDYNTLEFDDGSINERGTKDYFEAVKTFTEQGFNVIIDLHKAPGFVFDHPEDSVLFESEALQERLLNIWKRLATMFVPFGDKVAFELLNEIVEQECHRWNALVAKLIPEIRKIAPTTKIIVGSIQWNSAHTLHLLEKPYDENIVFNFHFYEPFLFTHQKAPWVEQMPKTADMDYPATLEAFRQRSEEINCFGSGLNNSGITEMGAAYMESIMQNAIDTANKWDTYLYCGEYGVIDLANPEAALRWYRDINSVFVKNGIGRAAWTYKVMDFGLADEHMSSVIDEVVKYL